MRGHNVMLGYAGNDIATAEAFRGGWFHSQDLGFEVIDDGRRFVVTTGRIKNIAKIGGRAVSLEEMDRVLRKLPHVTDAACVTVPHALLGEQIVAAVVLSQPVEDSALRGGVAEVFAAAVMPARFVRLERLPRTQTGKILRAKLAELVS
jgi:acyl-CoA synthetase (AMP-forming)/AMP-acid ligase II